MDLTEFINQNLRVFQLTMDDQGNGPLLHRRYHLQQGIEKWSQIFRSLDLPPNPTIGLLHELNFEYMCMLYAGLGIGANFVVLDARFDERSSHKVFLPLDLLVYDYLMDTMVDDISYWEENARNLIDSRTVPQTRVTDSNTGTMLSEAREFDPIHTQILSSTTSGSTGSVKTVSHSYQYILDIAKRNAQVLGFSGRAAHIKNLYHGSSMPVFYLPALIKCDFHHCVPWTDAASRDDVKKYVRDDLGWAEHLDINHILFPYTYMLDKFLEAVVEYDMFFTDLTVYTLSYIKPEYKDLIRGRNIKIVSIFGCTETSGPVMINSLCNQNLNEFDPTVFYTPDNFFTITAVDDGTRIQSKNGLVDHVMSDRFEKISENTYRHLGRADLYRINDVVIDLAKIADVRAQLGIDGDIIVDSVQQSIYLAIWNDDDAADLAKRANQLLAETFGSELIYVARFANLNKLEFISGIKPNQEMIREHFRNLED